MASNSEYEQRRSFEDRGTKLTNERLIKELSEIWDKIPNEIPKPVYIDQEGTVFNNWKDFKESWDRLEKDGYKRNLFE